MLLVRSVLRAFVHIIKLMTSFRFSVSIMDLLVVYIIVVPEPHTIMIGHLRNIEMKRL
jgi:hypothetical protein